MYHDIAKVNNVHRREAKSVADVYVRVKIDGKVGIAVSLTTRSPRLYADPREAVRNFHDLFGGVCEAMGPCQC